MLALLLLQAGQCWRQMTDWLRRTLTVLLCKHTCTEDFKMKAERNYLSSAIFVALLAP